MAESNPSLALLQEAEFAQVMLLVDGELTGAERTAAETLVARSAEAKALYDALSESKLALRHAIVDAPVDVDLSRIRDNVLKQTVLAATAQPRPVQEQSLVARLMAWLEDRSPLGKLSLVAGAAAAVALWMVVAADRVPAADPASLLAHGPSGAGMAIPSGQAGPMAVASVQGDGIAADPQTLFGEIEELEVESGSVLVSPADTEGSTVIWHFAEGQQG
jgi:hypothetical protein